MNAITAEILTFSDLKLVQLAREIAIDHHDLPEILQRLQISEQDWDRIKHLPRFQQLLQGEIAAWQSATNTHERTKLKAAALLEEFLPEANAMLHDRSQDLGKRVELGKLLERISGMSAKNADVSSVGEKFSITINLGADTQLKFEKDVTPKVIDHEPSTQE